MAVAGSQAKSHERVRSLGWRARGAFANRREASILVVAIGLIIYFSLRSSAFYSTASIKNIADYVAPVALISAGEVMLLICGEIDLSVGFVSGVAGVLVALLTFPDNHNVFAAGPALVLALAAGVGIGLLHGVIITKLGVPSFVVTLAGLLAWNGAVLLLIGDRAPSSSRTASSSASPTTSCRRRPRGSWPSPGSCCTR